MFEKLPVKLSGRISLFPCCRTFKSLENAEMNGESPKEE